MFRKAVQKLTVAATTAGVGSLTAFGLYRNAVNSMTPEERRKIRSDVFAKFPARRLVATPKPGGSSWTPW